MYKECPDCGNNLDDDGWCWECQDFMIEEIKDNRHNNGTEECPFCFESLNDEGWCENCSEYVFDVCIRCGTDFVDEYTFCVKCFYGRPEKGEPLFIDDCFHWRFTGFLLYNKNA